MALDFKSVASNQFASRSNRAVQAGLKKVSGNILGSALGTTSPSTAASLSNFSLGFADSGPFSTKMLSFPSDVATDPRQGHYINFSIYKTEPAKVFATETASRKSKIATALVANAASQLDPVSGPSGLSPGALGGRTGVGGDQLIVGADAKAIQKLDTQGRTFDAVGSAGKGSNKSNSIRLRRHSTKRVGGIISLYMPPNVSVTYNAGYTDEPIGGIAELAENVIAGVTSAEDLNEAIGNVVSETNIKGIDQAGRQAILGIINAACSGARSVYAINQGQIITPRMELMFTNMGRRDFSYSFVFIPRDQNEASMVELIVREFKLNMAADYKEDMGVIAGMRTMGIPNIFKIEYMYHNAPNTHLNTIGFCALRNVEVSYGGDRFVSYEGGVPQQTRMTLNFTELDIITKSMIEEGR